MFQQVKQVKKLEFEWNPEEIADYVERELENFYNLGKFAKVLDSSIFFHKNQCRHILCSNCTFIEKLIDLLIENFPNEENIVNNLKNCCRERFRNFLSLITLLKCIAAMGEEHRDHILYRWNVNIGTTP